MTDKIIPRICIIPHCGVSVRVSLNGYCLNHYRRWKRYGNPLQFYDTVGDTPVDRFWSIVDRTGGTDACWLFTGKRVRKGYGRRKYNGKYHLAHHIAWHITYGEFPKDCLLHSCDNPPCVNPKHLRQGDHYENVRDRQKRQRQSRGEVHPHAKLKASDIPAIREALARKERMTDIAKRYNVFPTTIFGIKHRLTWKHVE